MSDKYCGAESAIKRVYELEAELTELRNEKSTGIFHPWKAALEGTITKLSEQLEDWTRRSESCESKLGQLEANERVMVLEDEISRLTAQVAMQAEVLREVRGFFAARETVLSSIVPLLDSALSDTAETAAAWKRENVSNMNLYAFQPGGHGELSFFVMAESEELARLIVGTEIKRRVTLPYTDVERLHPDQYAVWKSNYYTLTVAKAAEVLTNEND